MKESGQLDRRLESKTFYLFWPSVVSLKDPSSGYLVGWKKGSVYCIATIFHQTDSLDSLQQLLGQSAHLSEHAIPRVLGYVNLPWHPSSRPSEQDEGDWISVIYANGVLEIKGHSPEDTTIVVIYDRPSMRKHHFLSLRPLLKPSLFLNQSQSPVESSRNDRLAQKIKEFDLVYPELALPRQSGCQLKEMSDAIDFINSSEKLHARVHNLSTPGNPHPNKPSSGDDHARNRHSLPFHLGSILALSTFLQQLNVRLVEISSWPSRYRKITREEDTDLPGRRAEYVMLFNTLWLIANDIIFGRAVGLLLIENNDLLADGLEYYLEKYTVALVKRALDWTNSYPVGLKLNDQLGQAFCICSNVAVDFWHIYVLEHAFGVLPKMIWIAGVVSFIGNTFTLAIASDFLTIATFHLWVIYQLITFIFDCQLRFLGVLFNIFRGRKYNVLRKRNEPASYQLDQLILGTILFTLAIFLFPTILAFYMLMSSTRIIIIWIHGFIGTSLSLLNHFPLFILMLRLKDPARLPAGVCFIPLENHPIGQFKIQNVAVGLTWIFADYISLWASLTSHYSPRQLLYRLCSGKPIAPLANRAVFTRP